MICYFRLEASVDATIATHVSPGRQTFHVWLILPVFFFLLTSYLGLEARCKPTCVSTPQCPLVRYHSALTVYRCLQMRSWTRGCSARHTPQLLIKISTRKTTFDFILCFRCLPTGLRASSADLRTPVPRMSSKSLTRTRARVAGSTRSGRPRCQGQPCGSSGQG